MSSDNYGKLYIVATAIGNLEDMSFRAIRILSEVDLICAEDTRNTIKLLNHYNIKTKMIAYHKNNRYEKIDEIIQLLKEGKNIAIVSDAGTPLISDPGYELVQSCYNENIIVNTIPGACAAISALTLSALSCYNFTFFGFLPEEKKERKKFLDKIQNHPYTMIFYISPHKLLKDLENLINTFGTDRKASLSKEITKIHEKTFNMTLGELFSYFSNNDIKGEYVLVISANDKQECEEKKEEEDKETIEEQYKKLIAKGINEKEAMKEIAKTKNIDKREVYKLVKIKK